MIPAMVLPPIGNIPEIGELKLRGLGVKVRLHPQNMFLAILHFDQPQSIFDCFLLLGFIETIRHTHDKICKFNEEERYSDENIMMACVHYPEPIAPIRTTPISH